MIIPSYEIYKNTNPIKNGKKNIYKRYNKFLNWLEEYYCKPLNIYCDILREKYGRITIILKSENDLIKYNISKNNIFRIKKSVKKKILKNFNELVKEPIFKNIYDDQEYNFLEETELIICTFENISKIVTIDKIKKNEIKKLLKDINNPELWIISRLLSYTTFFVFTEKQLKKYKNDKITIQDWTKKYMEIIKHYDEYGYFKKDYKIKLDSKENFDTNYNSNWYYYYYK